MKWKGYPTSENTWEPINHLRNCAGALDDERSDCSRSCPMILWLYRDHCGRVLSIGPTNMPLVYRSSYSQVSRMLTIPLVASSFEYVIIVLYLGMIPSPCRGHGWRGYRINDSGKCGRVRRWFRLNFQHQKRSTEEEAL